MIRSDWTDCDEANTALAAESYFVARLTESVIQGLKWYVVRRWTNPGWRVEVYWELTP